MAVEDGTPQTEADAEAAGLEMFSEEEWRTFEAKVLHTFSLDPPIRCSEHPVGTKCLEVGCIDGFRAVVFCDANRKCTRRYKIPC